MPTTTQQQQQQQQQHLQRMTTTTISWSLKWLVLIGSLCNIPTLVVSSSCDTTAADFDFESLWIFQLSPPGNNDVQQQQQEEEEEAKTTFQLELEVAILELFQCQDDGDATTTSSSSSYQLTNVSVRLDLMETLFLEEATTTMNNTSSTPNNNNNNNPMAIPVSVQGTSNIASLWMEGPDGSGTVVLFSDDDDDDDSNGARRHRSALRRQLNHQQGCGCSVPSKESFLQDLQDSLGITNLLLDVTEMKEIDCPATAASSNVTSFSAGIAVDVLGDIDLVSEQALQVYTNLVIDKWNAINFYENCDDTNSRLIAGVASIDPESVLRGVYLNPEENDRRRRQQRQRDLMMIMMEYPKQQERQSSLQNGTATAAPSTSNLTSSSSSAAPSSRPTTTTTTTTSLSPSSSPTASTTTSLTTEGPTSAPTSRGPDLFRLLISLTGVCRGCPTDNNLFVQVSERKLEEEEEQRLFAERQRPSPLQEQRPTRSLVVTSSFAPDDCFCPVKVLPEDEGQEGIVQEDFFLAVNRAVPEEVDFVDDVVTIKEVDVFPCQRDAFASFATLVFSGDPELVDTKKMEGLFQRSFQRQAELGCDPLVRSLETVKTVRTVVLQSTGSPSEMPSEMPSESPSEVPSEVPSEGPSVSERRRNTRSLQTNGTAIPSMAPTSNSSVPSEMPSETPSTQEPSKATETAQPTNSPTAKGPDLFYILFELSGTCNGCSFESNFFDDVSFGTNTRRLQRRQRSGKESDRRGGRRPGAGVRFLERQQEGLCACEQDADPIGVPLDDFVEDMNEEISQGDFSGIEEIQDATELDTLPPTFAPTVSIMPSSKPSEMPSSEPSLASWHPVGAGEPLSISLSSKAPSEQPSASPSSDPSGSPSSFPSEYPSEFPSVYPSAEPSSRPSGMPSLSPSWNPSSSPSMSSVPSTQPSENPSGSIMPSLIPSSKPSSSPSNMPSSQPSLSGAPSSEPSRSPSLSSQPSVLPSSRPSTSPSGLPSVSPSLSSVPSVKPSRSPSLSSVPSVVPSSVPSISPSSLPSVSPSESSEPSLLPSRSPSLSIVPSVGPSSLPSVSPSTSLPSSSPSTSIPISSPSVSSIPSLVPSSQPSADPTSSPTACFSEDSDCISDSEDRLQLRPLFQSQSICVDDPVAATVIRQEYDKDELVIVRLPCCADGTFQLWIGCASNAITVVVGLDEDRSTECRFDGQTHVPIGAIGNLGAGTPIFFDLGDLMFPSCTNNECIDKDPVEFISIGGSISPSFSSGVIGRHFPFTISVEDRKLPDFAAMAVAVPPLNSADCPAPTDGLCESRSVRVDVPAGGEYGVKVTLKRDDIINGRVAPDGPMAIELRISGNENDGCIVHRAANSVSDTDDSVELLFVAEATLQYFVRFVVPHPAPDI